MLNVKSLQFKPKSLLFFTIFIIYIIGFIQTALARDGWIYCFNSVDEIKQNRVPPPWSGSSTKQGDGPTINFTGQSKTVFCMSPDTPNNPVAAHSGCACKLQASALSGTLKYLSTNYIVTQITANAPCINGQCFNAYVP